jgi:ABC-type sulfate transport system substrate-binding protein
MRTGWLNAIALAAVAITLVILKNVAGDSSTQRSYDPTRELFQDLNQQFVDKRL